jgi:hypothetical protein
MTKLFFALALLLGATNSVFSQKKLVFSDRVYEEQVRTVLAYPAMGNPAQAAAVPLQQQNLVLAFDDIQESKNNYYVRLVHCNFNWSKSSLLDLDFLSEYNEFPINDYQLSINTHLPYVHYRFAVPAVKIPGNYLLVVYRDGDREDIIISKRILVYDSRVSLATSQQWAGQGTLAASNQQINFILSYRQQQLLNPYENIHVVIRQNQRWDNARWDIKPSFLREDVQQLEYRFFDQDKQWAAGNEFRFVDFRSLNFPGQNTARLDRGRKPYELYVQPDGSRADQAYAQYRDLNGQFLLENRDMRDAALSSQYLFVNFSLRTTQLPNASVYVVGAFNQWAREAENKMRYNAATGAYEASVLLKQGLFNYQYWVDSPDASAYLLEGSHFETENVYEILVYYSALQPRADLLMGYYLLPVNPR